MEQTTFVNSAPAFDGFRAKAEQMLCEMYPGVIDSGHYKGISIGRNTDSGIGMQGGYRVSGTEETMRSALHFKAPTKMLPAGMLADPDLRRVTVETRVADAVVEAGVMQMAKYMENGMSKEDAQRRVNDSVKKVGYYDSKEKRFVIERIANRVNDSILQGMTTPMWDVTVIQKIFRQPFLRGYADGMVSSVGVPNVWANLVQIFTETFEGYARVSNVAKTNTTFNTSIAAKNRTGTMLSELINLVIDYESPQVQEQIVGGKTGNWLTNAAGMGSRDAYANLMLEQLMNVLIYFGHAETGFEGLYQIANRDGMVERYDGKPADVLWAEEEAGTNSTVGADLLVKLSHFLANKMEDLSYLPLRCEVRCSPVLWKVFQFSQLSRVYNQNNPLSIINNAYYSAERVTGTLVTKSGMGVWNSFTMVPDPMLAPNTPFNKNDHDLMFITFPELQSELDGGMSDMIIMPHPIENMILPSAPGFRDGVVRTALKRVGSILAPVEKVVHVIEGMGTNGWYS